MAVVIHCSDLGFECEGIVRADSEDEALQMVAEHAKAVHGLDEISPEVAEQAKAAIREE